MKFVKIFLSLLFIDLVSRTIVSLAVNLILYVLYHIPIINRFIIEQMPDAWFIVPMLIAQALTVSFCCKHFASEDLWRPMRLYSILRISLNSIMVLMVVIFVRKYLSDILVYIYSIAVGAMYYKNSMKAKSGHDISW